MSIQLNQNLESSIAQGLPENHRVTSLFYDGTEAKYYLLAAHSLNLVRHNGPHELYVGPKDNLLKVNRLEHSAEHFVTPGVRYAYSSPLGESEHLLVPDEATNSARISRFDESGNKELYTNNLERII